MAALYEQRGKIMKKVMLTGSIALAALLWSVIPLAALSTCGETCGDGIVVGNEDCDDGILNGTAESCCTAECSYKASGAACNDGTYCNGPDTCDGAGQCNQHAGDPCASGGECEDSCNELEQNCLVPIGTPCGNTQSCEGAMLVNADQCNGAGVCADGGAESCAPFICNAGGTECLKSCETNDDCIAGTTCLEEDDTCYVTASCAGVPLAGCKQPMSARTASLLIKHRDGKPSTDKVVWKWRRGEKTDILEVGNPFTGPTTYAFCVYDGDDSLIYKATIPFAGACGKHACWRSTRQGFGTTYNDPSKKEEGVKKIKIKAKEAGRAAVRLKATNRLGTMDDDGEGNGLLLFPPYDNLPVTVQLVNKPDGTCWQATFDDPGILRNRAGQFRARSVSAP